MDTLKKKLSKTPSFISMLKSGDTEILKKSYGHFIIPKFRTGQTGCSRRDINVWRKEGLLTSTNEENTWNQFSIADCVWLRFVAMLKKFGVDNTNILQIKNSMFSIEPGVVKETFTSIKNMPKLSVEISNYLEEVLKILKEVPEDEIRQNLKEINFSFFNIFVMLCCKIHMQFAIIINEDAEYTFLNIGMPFNETTVDMGALMTPLYNRSFLLINLYQLCKDFFENEAVLIDSQFYFGLMNEFEQQVLTEIRTGKYKMVTVKVSNGAISHIKLTKNDTENEEMLRKLSRLFKTNDFKDIELTTRDGVVIKYSETDVIKLNTK